MQVADDLRHMLDKVFDERLEDIVSTPNIQLTDKRQEQV